MITTLNVITGSLVILNYFYLCTCGLLETKLDDDQKISNKLLDILVPKITTVSLTQKGYIQFLRYTKKVPVIEEFTFCIWMKVDNFTYPQPILSYSKDSKTRLIRVWLTPEGEDINFAIMEIPVFKIPLILQIDQWYHFCTSWDNQYGAWALYVNGKIAKVGFNQELRDVIIPEGGDIVVGQELTDMDKGLDDGIEGTIFGFNMVLSSVFDSAGATTLKKHLKVYEEPVRRSAIFHRSRRRSGTETLIELPYGMDFPRPLPHFVRTSPLHSPEAISFDGKYTDPFGKFMSQEINADTMSVASKKTKYQRPRRATSEIKKSLGYQLVRLSFNECTLGNGSPLGDINVLISWTKTSVRVFGGAVLNKVEPFC
ncbi:uncharacterized protein LOC108740788 isoform X2 [Agrilus planipennis]|nr:uncharacterized protein LOC108740788 isoform X2 [Agrilus planipennis]